MKCINCGQAHGCSCKKRIASDGKVCCTVCVARYEAELRAKKLVPNS